LRDHSIKDHSEDPDQALQWDEQGFGCHSYRKALGKAAMHTEDPFGDNRSDWKTIDNIGKFFPDLDTTSSLALVIKTVDLREIGIFMVTPE
jgi:hypothetical protein